MAIFNKFLKLSISQQIRIGILLVISFSVLILAILLFIITLLQTKMIRIHYEEIIENENDDMILNVENYIFSVEDSIILNSKKDLKFLSLLEKNFFANLDYLEMRDLFNIYNIKENDKKVFKLNDENSKYDKCFSSNEIKCLVYNFIENDTLSSLDSITDDTIINHNNNISFGQMKIYYDLIFPILKNIIEKKIVATHPFNLYKNFQLFQKINENISLVLYMSNKYTPFNVNYPYNSFKLNLEKKIDDYLLNIYTVFPYLYPNLNFIDILLNKNSSIYPSPLVLSSYLFDNRTQVPYKYNTDQAKNNFFQNEMEFETQLLTFDQKDFLIENLLNNTNFNNHKEIAKNLSSYFNSLSILGWTNSIFNNIISLLIGQYYLGSNLFVLSHPAFHLILKGKNITNASEITQKEFTQIKVFGESACLLLVKSDYKKNFINNDSVYDYNLIEIMNNCNISFSEDLEEHFKNQKGIIIDKREKLNIEIASVNINYSYYYYDDGKQVDQKNGSIIYDKSKANNEIKEHYKFKVFKGIFPIDSLNYFKTEFYRNFLTMNFYISKSIDNYIDKEIVNEICFNFLLIILIINYSIWLLVIIFIVIIVLKISHSISGPIDRLIQSVSKNDSHSKSNNELKNYLKNISYKDDTTINDLFLLCKKLIIGGPQGNEEIFDDTSEKNKTKHINPYNNICLVKSNNMIIDEIEIIKREKKQEINFFEKNVEGKAINEKSNKNLEVLPKNRFNYKILSSSLFSEKFYKWNKGSLIMEKRFYDLVTNENTKTFNISRKKKNNAEDV